MKIRNIFEDIPDALPDELVEEILRTGDVRVERIVSRGHAADEGDWSEPGKNEWVILLAGGAEVEFEGRGETVVLTPGDYLGIAAHTRHRVVWTDAEEDTVWLVIYYEPGEYRK